MADEYWIQVTYKSGVSKEDVFQDIISEDELNHVRLQYKDGSNPQLVIEGASGFLVVAKSRIQDLAVSQKRDVQDVPF